MSESHKTYGSVSRRNCKENWDSKKKNELAEKSNETNKMKNGVVVEAGEKALGERYFKEKKRKRKRNEEKINEEKMNVEDDVEDTNKMEDTEEEANRQKKKKKKR